MTLAPSLLTPRSIGPGLTPPDVCAEVKDGKPTITFGAIFAATIDTMPALAATISTAKKRYFSFHFLAFIHGIRNEFF